MKTHEETAQRVLARRDEYDRKRKAQRKRLTTAAACFCCCCALLGAGAWRTARAGKPALTGDWQSVSVPPDSGIQDCNEQNREQPRPAITENSTEERSKQKQRADWEIRIDSADGPAPVGEPNREERAREPNWNDFPVTELPDDTGALRSTGSVWGGSYMENGQWYVLLTENTAEYQYEVFCMNPALKEGSVTFLTADYSLDYLTELMQRISDRMADGSLSVASGAMLREERNRVELDVSTDVETARRQLAALGIETDALDIVPGRDAVTEK